ncbi:hypothetical protein LDENG_00110980 [Lucifuga dentata]|nr:hypothetical protein LDENG_00110980 [Lucifuga dentata]
MCLSPRKTEKKTILILRSMVQKLTMKVYCGCYSAPIRSVDDSFCSDVCSEHVHQVWLQ